MNDLEFVSPTNRRIERVAYDFHVLQPSLICACEQISGPDGKTLHKCRPSTSVIDSGRPRDRTTVSESTPLPSILKLNGYLAQASVVPISK